MVQALAEKRHESFVIPKKKTSARRSVQKERRSRYEGKKMEFKKFMDWEPSPDGFKYEWNEGVVESREYMMKNTERYLVKKIFRKFRETDAYKNGDELFSETRCFFEFLNKIRIPDIAYFSASQIEESNQKKEPIPTFVIEIISPSDKSYRVEEKMHEYFSVGVKVVWHIYPQLKEVRIFASPKEIQVCSGNDLCTAKPVLDDFEIEVNELFG